MALSGWDRLGQDRAYIANRARASLPRSLQSAANAIHELITASPPPGSQKMFVFPHDHGRRGGTPLARGSHWSFCASNQNSWRIQAASTTLEYWLKGTAGTTTNSSFETTPANFVLDVPWGLDSSRTSLGGAPLVCWLEAKVRVFLPTLTGNTQVSVRFRNSSTGTSSSAVLATAFGSVSLLTFSDIPILEDERNNLILTVQPNVAAIDVDIISVNICSTRSTTQPLSSGSQNIEANPKP